MDEAWSDGPGGESPFINSFPVSVNDPGFGGTWSGLDTGDGSSGIGDSGRVTSVHPSAGLGPGFGSTRFQKLFHQLSSGHGGSGSGSVQGLFFEFVWDACAITSESSGLYSLSKSSGSDRVASEDAVDDGFDDFVNVLGWAVDDAGFDAELEEACAASDNAGFGTGACTSSSSYNHS